MDTRENVAAVLMHEPQMAPNSALAPMVALASAPRSPENRPLQASKSSRAMLARDATAPIRMKSGITESEYALARGNGTRPNIFSPGPQPSTAAYPTVPVAATPLASG